MTFSKTFEIDVNNDNNNNNNDNNNNMLIVQYPMQFSGPPRNISNPCSAPLCAGELWFN